MNLESKNQKIADACAYNDVDELIELATSEAGLVNDELRCSACEFGQTLLILRSD